MKVIKNELDNLILKALNEHKELLNIFDSKFIKEIINFSILISNTLKSQGTIFWCGNGGSASDSQHFSAELLGRFKKDRIPLKSVSLNTDLSLMTCIANDFGYENIFSRQIEGLGTNKDMLIGISTSGKSVNVINAIKEANGKGIQTLALLGNDGGEIINIANHSIVIPSSNTARIQEMHTFIGHLLCELIEKELNLA